MKKLLILIMTIALIITVTACTKTDENALSSLPDDYSYDDAVADGLVVFENSSITSGDDVWETFLETVNNGEKTTVRLAYYFTLDDRSEYALDYYEEIKDDFPILFVKDLTFDGSSYTIEGYEDGELISKTYAYLVKYEGEPTSETAVFNSYLYYVLVNDDTLTWEEIEQGLLSSQYGAAIDHYRVYSELSFKCPFTINPS